MTRVATTSRATVAVIGRSISRQMSLKASARAWISSGSNTASLRNGWSAVAIATSHERRVTMTPFTKVFSSHNGFAASSARFPAYGTLTFATPTADFWRVEREGEAERPRSGTGPSAIMDREKPGTQVSASRRPRRTGLGHAFVLEGALQIGRERHRVRGVFYFWCDAMRVM
jgi:hypothetical protein